MKIKLDPTRLLALVLGIMMLFAFLKEPSLSILWHFLATVGLAIALYWAMIKIKPSHKNIYNSIITGQILFLIVHPSSNPADFAVVLIATFLAMFVKFFVEIRKSPVINPAVFALLLAAGVAAAVPGLDLPFVSWWGASFKATLGPLTIPYLTLILMLFWLVYGVRKWRKLPIALTFLAAHYAILLLRGGGLEQVGFMLTDSTMLFFAGVMLIEPKTSPKLKRSQIIFGLIAAISFSVLLESNVSYYDLFAIAIANLANIWLLPRRRKKKVVTA